MIMEQMTSEEYVRIRGVRCPFCGSGDGITGEHIEVDAGGAYQDVWCASCGKSWVDEYKLVGYSP